MIDSSSSVTSPKPAARTVSSFTDQLIEPLSRLRNEVDRLFDDFPFRPAGLRTHATDLVTPALDMSETEEAYLLRVEVPGMDPSEIDITVRDDMLRIAGEMTERRDEKEKGWRLSERRFGAFERAIALPEDAQPDAISARCEKGVLTITIPRDHDAVREARKIPVQSG